MNRLSVHLWINQVPAASDLTLAAVLGARLPKTSNWTVLDLGGRWLGTVQVSDGLEVMEVGSDYILGVREDDLGLAFVERDRILKPE